MAPLEIHNSVKPEKFTATAALHDGQKGRFASFAAPGKGCAPPARGGRM